MFIYAIKSALMYRMAVLEARQLLDDSSDIAQVSLSQHFHLKRWKVCRSS